MSAVAQQRALLSLKKTRDHLDKVDVLAQSFLGLRYNKEFSTFRDAQLRQEYIDFLAKLVSNLQALPRSCAIILLGILLTNFSGVNTSR